MATREPDRADSGVPRQDPILIAMYDLVGWLREHGRQVARDAGLQPPTAMALSQIDKAITMKDLAQRLGCERSFVTAIADELEQKGLARREPDPHDRRVKNLTLTRKGLAERRRVVDELSAAMPWMKALNETERAALLDLLTKMARGVRG